jgi:restriction endonuclease
MKVTIEDDNGGRVELPAESVQLLDAIATRNRISFVEALQQAIANENFLDEQASSSKLLIEQGGTIHELVRKRQPA